MRIVTRLIAFLAAVTGMPAFGQVCPNGGRTVTADVVAIDQPIIYNRLGSANVNGNMFALRSDVVHLNADGTVTPLNRGGSATPGEVRLRPDKRPRPMTLRVAAGDCLAVSLQNLLTPTANPNNIEPRAVPATTVFVDDSPADRTVGFHANGMQLVNSIADDGSNTGKNASSLLAPGQSATYVLYAQKEGVFLFQSLGATIGGDGNQGQVGNGLFGQVIVGPKGAKIYRSMVTEEELRLAMRLGPTCPAGSAPDANNFCKTPQGQPVINYDATFPATPGSVWDKEGRDPGSPVLATIDANNRIVHSDMDAIMAGPNPDGSFPPSTYPLESVNRRNPTVPNRLEAFRDFSSAFHDEFNTAQAFPGFFNDTVMKYVLAAVGDKFAINYGSGAIGNEIIANRLGVGPMHDCVSCAYEEFFLTSFVVGDPAMVVDIPANVGLTSVTPGQTPPAGSQGPKATFALYPADPSNLHHSYIGDFTKIRNTHVGKEQHVFHLHNHQWLFNPNDDNANYLDAQGIGPGAGYTYEINFGGSGNRNKSAGDSIYHCHFYPHFAMGMWYHWRHHDVLELGTRLAASGGDYHTVPFALANGTPAAGARALPDGEIAVGTPIPAIVPLPGKAMPPVPADVTVVANGLTSPFNGKPVGSLAKIDRTGANGMYGPDGVAGTPDDRNPGYPFWIAGMEDIVGQRPPTPVLDMLDKATAQTLKASGDPLWAAIVPDQADGWDGGLRRHSLLGYSSGGVTATTTTAIDFTKKILSAKPVYFPESGTDAEQAAMQFHKQRRHASTAVKMDGSVTPADFITNGAGPVVGAPYHEPCMDDNGQQLLAGVVGNFFSGEAGSAANGVGASGNTGSKLTRGASFFNAQNVRKYKGANIQFDAVLSKTGYHYPQQRIVALWQDVVPIVNKQQPPEPLVMRLNTFDCAVYSHTNLVPEIYEMDDYQIRTPTDIIGQHIHLPKWDLTTTDGSANGWNYEDGTLSPGAVRERIEAIRTFNNCAPTDGPSDACPVPKSHPYFGQFARADWQGARTTMQRWFADPVVNVDGVDRGLGIIFTHDHYGPSTHQQIGLYSTVLIEPAGSKWVHNEKGTQLGYDPATGVPARTASAVTGQFSDGGPTSWQAAILPQAQTGVYASNTVKAGPCGAGGTALVDCAAEFREFYLEFSDFQHAYEKGVYVGAGPTGQPLPGATPRDRFQGVATIDDAFRYAINPPMRAQISPIFPDIVIELPGGVDPRCPQRPCPQAISAQDPGLLVVNYRAEPVAMRVFDPNANGPDGRKGAQASGIEGDLAFALASRMMDKAGNITPITRKVAELNQTEAQLQLWNGAMLNSPAAVLGADPFTPMLRAYAGDQIRVKIQAGAHEEEHNASVLGLRWLQGGSGFGRSPNSGWRASQAAGISEQFTLSLPILPPAGTPTGGGVINARDYVYTIDSAVDGWWSGDWGLMRVYNDIRTDLFLLPSNPNPKPDKIANKTQFDRVCPIGAPAQALGVIAILANDLLPKPAGVTIADQPGTHNGAAVKANGGTLVYNSRNAQVPNVTGVDAAGNVILGTPFSGPLHDPTAILYVRQTDVEPDPTRGGNAGQGSCKDTNGMPAVGNALCPIRLKAGVKVEPLMMRASAGDCMKVTLYNRMPAKAPDLPTYTILQGANKRDRFRPLGAAFPNATGSVPFDNNLVRPSSYVGITPQLVGVDVVDQFGLNAGINVTQTVPPVDALGKTSKATYSWYAGDLTYNTKTGNLDATPVEFGGFSLSPTDRVKQGQKSMVGAVSILPQGTNVKEDAGQHAQATVTFKDPVTGAARTARDLLLVVTKTLNHRYADGSPVPHINGEAVGIPEDSQEASNMAMNYGIEPLWFRLGIAPNAPFGPTNAVGSFANVANAHNAYSNALVGGDPQTPVFTVNRGTETRMHVVVPHGSTRGSTLLLHGHVWQRDPYYCANEARVAGMPGTCNMAGVGSKSIGLNPLGFAMGSQDNMTPLAHFTYFLPSAGGANQVPGDYLFRDQGAFGNVSGLWGILRVQ